MNTRRTSEQSVRKEFFDKAEGFASSEGRVNQTAYEDLQQNTEGYENLFGNKANRLAKKEARKKKKIAKRTAKGKDTSKLEARLQKVRDKIASLGVGSLTADEKAEYDEDLKEETAIANEEKSTVDETATDEEKVLWMPKTAGIIVAVVGGLGVIALVAGLLGAFKKKKSE
jgi:hypothetical protein